MRGRTWASVRGELAGGSDSGEEEKVSTFTQVRERRGSFRREH